MIVVDAPDTIFVNLAMTMAIIGEITANQSLDDLSALNEGTRICAITNPI
ncbi:MAG: hypothetical protein OHK0012_06320 [Synechococcales cyanobacterium]